MSRTSTVPTVYSTLDELERGFRHQLRRFRKAGLEQSATRPFIMSGGNGGDEDEPARRPAGDVDPDHQRLELIRAQVILLQNMAAQILTNFPGDARAKQLRQRVEAFCETLEKQSQDLRVTLGQAARKVVGRAVVVRNHALMETLKEQLKRNVRAVNEMYLVGDCTLPRARGPVRCDVAYLRLAELKGADGFTHPNYYIATAFPTGPSQGSQLLPMYIAGGPDYRTPARLRFTASARTPQEMMRVVSDLLVNDHVIGKTFGRDLPVPEASIKFVHDNVKRVQVVDGQIRITVKDKAQTEATRDALRRQLTGIVRQVDPKNRDVIRDRTDPAKGTIALVFSLPGKLRGRLVDDGMMRRIGSMLDLDPATLQRVRTAIENPE